MSRWILAVTFGAVVCAQVPNQTPSQVPNSGRRGRGQQRQTNISPLETPVATFHGTLKSITKKEVVLAVGEDQAIVFHVSSKTKFLQDGKAIKPSAIPSGASLTLDGKRDLKGNVEAVTVTVDADKKPGEPAAEPGPASTGSAAPPQ